MSSRGFQSSILLGWLGLLLSSLQASAAIPVPHLKGVDDLFISKYKIYSPLQGLLYKDSLMSASYQKEDETPSKDPLVHLVHELFTMTPGGQIIPSHVHRFPGANLAASTIAKILLEFENIKNHPGSVSSEILKSSIQVAILSDSGYREELAQAKKNIEEENSALEKYREFAELNKQLAKKDEKAQIKKHDTALRHNDVFSPDYWERLDAFINTLVESFVKYDFLPDPATVRANGTSRVLLSYLWSKGDTKDDLKEYLKVLSDAGVLTKKLNDTQQLPSYRNWLFGQSQVGPEFFTEYFTRADYQSAKAEFSKSKSRTEWVKANLSKSLLITDGESQNADMNNDLKTPPHVPFSYLTWVTFNPLYADCAENAIHNLFNLISYNSSTGTYDVNNLLRLKEKYYPNLNPKIIEYYQRYSTVEQHSTPGAKREWIELTIGLNDNRGDVPNRQKVEYMRARSEVKASQANIVKMVNLYLGYDDITEDKMTEIFERVKEVSGLSVNYSNPTKTGDWTDRREFQIGQTTFVIKSWAGLHCIFEVLPRENSQIGKEIATILQTEGLM